jgi:hypothetical protein
MYAFITGTALDATAQAPSGSLFLLSSDGHTPYFPSSPGSVGSNLTTNCAIQLGPTGSTTAVTIPHLGGARIWFSVGTPLTFKLNPGPALVEPSVTNPSDPNIGLEWDFAELTFNNSQVFANISYVDFVCLPISLTLTSTNAPVQHVSGMPYGSRGAVCLQLQAQSQADGQPGWASLVVPGVIPAQGAFLRALSPNNGLVLSGGRDFQGYFEPYVNGVWARYTGSSDISVNTQAQWGTVAASINAANGLMTFPSGITYAKPSTADIFSCSSGAFAPSSNIEQGAITARLAAAFNRSTLLQTNMVPASAGYYQDRVTNHYSRIVHQNNLDGRGYA